MKSQLKVPLTIVLVRHAEAFKDDGPGPLGPPLTPVGQRQAQRVARRLADDRLDHIYASDLTRAQQTAAAIRRHHRDTPHTVTADLREVLHDHYALRRTGRRSVVQAERARLERFARRLLRTHRAPQRILVVAHGNLIRALLPRLANRQPRQTVVIESHNTAVFILELWSPGDAVLRVANCVRHLNPNQVTGFLRAAATNQP
jgi:broad specificity phosphatase PhoE